MHQQLHIVCDACGHSATAAIEDELAGGWLAERAAEHKANKLRMVTESEHAAFVAKREASGGAFEQAVARVKAKATK